LIAKFAGSPIAKGAGIYLYKHEHEKVRKGEKILKVYAESAIKLEAAKQVFRDNVPVNIK